MNMTPAQREIMHANVPRGAFPMGFEMSIHEGEIETWKFTIGPDYGVCWNAHQFSMFPKNEDDFPVSSATLTFKGEKLVCIDLTPNRMQMERGDFPTPYHYMPR